MCPQQGPGATVRAALSMMLISGNAGWGRNTFEPQPGPMGGLICGCLGSYQTVFEIQIFRGMRPWPSWIWVGFPGCRHCRRKEAVVPLAGAKAVKSPPLFLLPAALATPPSPRPAPPWGSLRAAPFCNGLILQHFQVKLFCHICVWGVSNVLRPRNQ